MDAIRSYHRLLGQKKFEIYTNTITLCSRYEQMYADYQNGNYSELTQTEQMIIAKTITTLGSHCISNLKYCNFLGIDIIRRVR